MNKIKKEMVWERVLRGIVDYIVQNGLRSGDKLPSEREFCELFYVGRPAVREALSALSALKIVDIIQGDGIYFSDLRGTFLTSSLKLSYDLGTLSANALFEARILIESDAAELAAQRITPAQLARFEAYINESANEVEMNARFGQIDAEIHQLIYEACGNPVIATVMASINELVEKTRQVTTQFQEIRQVSHDFHEKIFFAIRGGDGQKAREFMGEHLRAVKRAADLHNAFYTKEMSSIFRQEFNLN